MSKPNDPCWIIENNYKITTATVKYYSAGFYTLLLNSGSAIRLKKHRVYETPEEAASNLKKEMQASDFSGKTFPILRQTML